MIYDYCRDCGKPLKEMKSRIRGYGAICFEKRQKQAAKSVVMKLDLDIQEFIEERSEGKNEK